MYTATKFLFWLYKGKGNLQGEAPIYVRIIIGKTKAELSTGIFIHPDNWDSGKCRIQTQKHLNEKLQAFKKALYATDIMGIKNAQQFKDRFQGKEVDYTGLLQVIKYHNEKIKSYVDREICERRYKLYLQTEKLLWEYLGHEITLDDCTHKICDGFVRYLKFEKGQAHNTVVTKIKILKSALNRCLLWGIIKVNPFDKFSIQEKVIMKDFLSDKELSKLESKGLPIGRLENVRRFFLFLCYTGLSYSDAATLTKRDIIEYGGRKWIMKERQKTDIPMKVPMSKKALSLLPLHPITNEKTNQYLKEIANLYGINKNLTCHLGRRTFAMSVLNKGVSVESVARMLGHASIRITQQHYAKVLPDRILREIEGILD